MYTKQMMLVLLWDITGFYFAHGNVNEKQELSKTKINSNYSGLAPPLVGASTTTQQNKSLSYNQEEENNLKRLCNDPFHSFLCKTVGSRRRRIDGRLRPGAQLPAGIKTASSNSKEEKQILEETALHPISTQNDRYYLPPLSQPPPVLQSEPQFAPPEILKNNTIESTPSNTLSRFSLLKPQTFYQPSPRSKDFFSSGSSIFQKTKNSYQSDDKQPTQVNYLRSKNTFLPPQETHSQPQSSNLSPTIIGKSLLQGINGPTANATEESSSLKRLCNDPFHSFLCKPVKPRKRIDGNIRSGAKLPPNFIRASSNIYYQTTVLNETGNSLLSFSSTNDSIRFSNENLFRQEASPKEPLSVIQNGKKFNTEIKTSPSQTYLVELLEQTLKKQQDNQSITINSSTNSRSYKCPQETPTTHSTFTPVPIMVRIIMTSPSTIQPYLYEQVQSKCSRPIQHDRLTVIQTPYPLGGPSQLQNHRQGERNTLSYPTTTSKVTIDLIKPYESKQRKYDIAYKSSNIFQNATNIQKAYLQAGVKEYTDNKPSELFTYLTEIASPVQLFKPPNNMQTYEYSMPTNIQAKISKFEKSGYANNKPTNILAYPTTTDKAIIDAVQPFAPIRQKGSFSNEPNNTFPNPTNIKKTIIQPENSGYQYNKPTNTLTYPTTTPKATIDEVQPFTPSRQNESFNYEPINIFPNPTNIQKTIVQPEHSGYQYNKPSYTLAYPTTTAKAIIDAVQPFTPSRQYKPFNYEPMNIFPNPTNIQKTIVQPENSGYQYNKPSYTLAYPTTTAKAIIDAVQPFTPSRQKESFNYEPINTFPNPTNIQKSFVQPEKDRYQYSMPTQIFIYPTATAQVEVERVPSFKPSLQQEYINYKQTYEYAKPTSLETTFSNPGGRGYQYNKPSITFIYPTTTANTTEYSVQSVKLSQQNEDTYYKSVKPSRPLTNSQPTIRPIASPSNVQENVAFKNRKTGYNYTINNNHSSSTHDKDFQPLTNFEIL